MYYVYIYGTYIHTYVELNVKTFEAEHDNLRTSGQHKRGQSWNETYRELRDEQTWFLGVVRSTHRNAPRPYL